MSVLIQLIKWTGPLAGIGAMILGLLHWFFHISFIEFHMIFGFLVTLALLNAGIIAICTTGLRILGTIALVLTIIVPVFGMNQMLILIGSFHWLIQVAHLLIGVVAISVTEKIADQYMQIKQKPLAHQEIPSIS